MPLTAVRTNYTQEEWLAQGEKLFGQDFKNWRFKCPSCNGVQTIETLKPFKDQGATPNDVYQQCVGRFTGGRKGPHKCDWASFGLFRGPVIVKATDDGKEIAVFDFDWPA